MLLLLPSFLTDLGWSSQMVGWAVGSYFLVNLVFQLVSGRLADRFGCIQVAMAGAVFGMLGGLGYVGALWYPWLIFVARFLHALGAAMIFVGALMQMIESVPVQYRGRMIGYYGLPGFVMMGLGPVLSEWFVYHWKHAGVFIAEPVLFLAILIALSTLPRKVRKETAPKLPLLHGFRESLDPLRSIVALSTLFGFCFSSWNSFLAPVVRPLGPGGVSAFGFGYGAGAVLTRLGISRRLDRGSARYAAVSTLVAYGGGLALIPHAATITHLAAIGLACGMVHGVFYPALSSIAAERFHPLHTGQAMSLYLSASALGMFVGPPIWGGMADFAGYAPMFWTAGGLMSAGTLWFVLRK
jgi:MFS family permease